MAGIEEKTKRYPSDLTDEEWDRLLPFMPEGARKGRRPGVDLREILNAIRYIARSGCSWRVLPKDFPPWQTVVVSSFHAALFVRDDPRHGADDRSRARRPRSEPVRRRNRQPVGEGAGGASAATTPARRSPGASVRSPSMLMDGF